MICIFCKQESDKSRSVEHIIPESLGNTMLTLPPGVVCDQCNNYFARKVEKPLLDSAALMTLRFHQSIPNKRRRIPPLDGVIQSGEPVTVRRFLDGAPVVDVSPEGFTALMSQKRSTLILPGTSDEWPENFASRFLAKAALEYMAFKLVEYPEGLKYIATESQLDLIRTFARRGGGQGWPYHVRRLYDIEKAWIEPSGEKVQRVYECEILDTPKGEYYFVVAIFGLEMAINYGGPDINGYLEWLSQNQNASPLYVGKTPLSSSGASPVPVGFDVKAALTERRVDDGCGGARPDEGRPPACPVTNLPRAAEAPRSRAARRAVARDAKRP